MMRASQMTAAQLAAAVARERDGRPDIASMTDEERRDAGHMTLREAVEWERLPIVPCARLTDRSRCPDANDPWAVGGDES